MLLKLIRTIHVIIVRVVPDDNSRILYNVLDETETRNLRIRERRIWVGSVGYLVHWVKYRFICLKIDVFEDFPKQGQA